MKRRALNICGYSGYSCSNAITPITRFLKDILYFKICSTESMDTASNNFGNIPRFIKGPSKQAETLDLSGITSDFKFGCLSLVDLFYHNSEGSFTFLRLVDLAKLVKNQHGFLAHKNYLSNNTCIDLAKISLRAHDVYLLPGILMPLVQPNPAIANLASVVPPSTIYTTSKTTTNTTLLNLKDFNGCSTAGILFRPSKGLLPYFVCLILCL